MYRPLPSFSGLEPWPAYQPADAQVQELGARIGPLRAPDHALCERQAALLCPGWSPTGRRPVSSSP